MDKLDQLARRRPHPDTRLFLQTARDIAYDAEKPDDYAAKRNDLDTKRITAIQKYLTATLTGRPATFDIQVHDPAYPGIDGAGPAGHRPERRRRGSPAAARPSSCPRRRRRRPRRRRRRRLRTSGTAAVMSSRPMIRPNVMSTMRSTYSASTGWRLAALAAAGCLCLSPTPAFAGGAALLGRVQEVLDATSSAIPSGVVVTVLVVGVICLFIITRGKWNKSVLASVPVPQALQRAHDSWTDWLRICKAFTRLASAFVSYS